MFFFFCSLLLGFLIRHFWYRQQITNSIYIFTHDDRPFLNFICRQGPHYHLAWPCRAVSCSQISANFSHLVWLPFMTGSLYPSSGWSSQTSDGSVCSCHPHPRSVSVTSTMGGHDVLPRLTGLSTECLIAGVSQKNLCHAHIVGVHIINKLKSKYNRLSCWKATFTRTVKESSSSCYNSGGYDDQKSITAHKHLITFIHLQTITEAKISLFVPPCICCWYPRLHSGVPWLRHWAQHYTVTRKCNFTHDLVHQNHPYLHYVFLCVHSVFRH